MYRRSLTLSIIEGSFWALMVGFGETYFPPYAISLGASDLQIGLLASLPLLAGSLAQLSSPWLVDRFKSRKRLVRTVVLFQALCYLPIVGVAFFTLGRPVLLILIVVVYWIFLLGGQAAWQSWIGDLVPLAERGHYFSRRNLWLQLATFVGVVTGGILLRHYNFILIFLVAMGCRLVSFVLLEIQEEPDYHPPAEAQFTFVEFVQKMRFNNYGIFVIFSSLFAVVHLIAGPYFSPYILRQLQFSNFEYMLAQAVMVASKSIFLPIWGHYSDRYGSRKLLSLSGYLMPLVPLLWMFSDRLSIVLAVQVVSGFVWAGYELCSFNFILDCTTPERRARCASYYQVFVGVGSVAGALLGALLMKHALFFNPYLFLFLVSALGRLLVTTLFLPKIKELREVERISYKTLLFRMVLFLKPGES